MKKNSFVASLLLSTLSGGFAATVLAADPPAPAPMPAQSGPLTAPTVAPRPAMPANPWANLTDDQRKALEDAWNGIAQQTRELRTKMNDARQALNDLAFTEKFDAEVARTKAAVLGNLEAEMATLRAGAVNKVRSVFTPEQLEGLKRLPMEMWGRMRDPRMAPRMGTNAVPAGATNLLVRPGARPPMALPPGAAAPVPAPK